MKEEIQIIERDGKPEWAVLPYDKYLELLEQAELLEDIRDFDAINAAAAGISKPYLSQIETGKRKGTTEILSAIAKALDVSLDEVVEKTE